MSQLKKGAILSYLNILLTNCIGLVLTPFILKSLGTNEYGLYILIGSFIAYFSMLDFGVGDTVIRYIARYRVSKTKNEEAVFLGSLLTVFFPIIVVILLIGIVTYFNIESLFGHNFNVSEVVLIKKMFAILLFNLVFSLFGNVFLGYINAYEKFVFTRTILIIKYLIRALTIYVVLSNGGMALSLVILDTVLNVLFFTINIFYCIKYLKIRFTFGKINSEFVKEIFSFSIWLFLLTLISNFQWQGGQLLLGFISSAKEIAVYSIGVLLGTYYGAFAAAITTMFLPHASRLIVQDVDGSVLTDAMIKIGRITSYVLMFILSSFLIFGKVFIRLWVGEDYDDAYYIASIIMIVYTFPLVQSYANSILEAKQLVRYKGSIYIVFILLGTSLGFFGYKYFGIIGVISSICIGWSIAFVIMNRFYVSRINLQITRFYKEVFFHQILPLCVIFSVGLYIIRFLNIQNWLDLTICAIGYTLLYSGIYYFIVLNKFEKSILIQRNS